MSASDPNQLCCWKTAPFEAKISSVSEGQKHEENFGSRCPWRLRNLVVLMFNIASVNQRTNVRANDRTTLIIFETRHQVTSFLLQPKEYGISWALWGFVRCSTSIVNTVLQLCCQAEQTKPGSSSLSSSFVMLAIWRLFGKVEMDPRISVSEMQGRSSEHKT